MINLIYLEIIKIKEFKELNDIDISSDSEDDIDIFENSNSNDDDDFMYNNEDLENTDEREVTKTKKKKLKLKNILNPVIDIQFEMNNLDNKEMVYENKESIKFGDFKNCFNNIIILYEIHIQFFERLQNTLSDEYLVQSVYDDIYFLLSQIDSYYYKFIKNFDKSIFALNNLYEIEEFRVIVDQILEKKSIKEEKVTSKKKAVMDISIQSLFITPIQRLPRYELLIKEIIKHSPKYLDDYSSFSNLLQSIENSTRLVDEVKGRENTKIFLQKFGKFWSVYNIRVNLKIKIR
jgi:hypothetical protein